MGGRRTRRVRGPIDGVCHICRAPADGPHKFQTRFCYPCYSKGMELNPANMLNSKFAIVFQLHRIQTSYDDVVQGVELAINSVLNGTPLTPEPDEHRAVFKYAGKLKSQGEEK